MTLAASLACAGFARSLRFYTDVLGFTTMRYDPAARTADLERDGVQIEIRETAEALAPLEYPFGRGATFVVWTLEAEAIYAGVQAYGARLHLPMADHWREEDGRQIGYRAFSVADPDGYVLRFCQPLASR
jgi:catechol 2,3-dioxygenase-like lactoylglutathione lyase family enzyme